MIVVIREQAIPRAKEIMAQYSCKLSYSKIICDDEPLFAISQGPVGALLLIRAELGDTSLQKRFGLS